MFAKMERLPSAIYDMKWLQCDHRNGSQFHSAVLHRFGHFGIWRAVVILSEQ
jgi:hypothetical protein